MADDHRVPGLARGGARLPPALARRSRGRARRGQHRRRDLRAPPRRLHRPRRAGAAPARGRPRRAGPRPVRAVSPKRRALTVGGLDRLRGDRGRRPGLRARRATARPDDHRPQSPTAPRRRRVRQLAAARGRREGRTPTTSRRGSVARPRAADAAESAAALNQFARHAGSTRPTPSRSPTAAG